MDENHYDDEKISATFLELMKYAGADDQATINDALYQAIDGLLRQVLQNRVTIDGLRDECKTLFLNVSEDLLQLQTDIAALIDVATQASEDYHKVRRELENHYRKCALYTLDQQAQAYIDKTQGY